jgi:iron complex transport system permease protein
VPLGISIAVCAALLVVAVGWSISWGAIDIPLTDVWSVVAHRGLHLPVHLPANATYVDIVWTLRAPRAVLAALVGCGLSLAGVAAQALVRNPLADPFVLGVSGGASVAAVASIVFGFAGFGNSTASASAFFGAIAALLMVLVFGRRNGMISPLRLVLAGVAIGHLLAGLTSFLVLQATDDHKVFNILFWLSGSLSESSWRPLAIPALCVGAGFVLLLADGPALNALLIGDETAASLGVHVAALRRRLLAVTALLTAVMVALSGIIGFVGLVVPHVSRMLVGSDHRRVVPIAALSGATFLVLCDLASRVLIAPVEIPVGIVTGVLGAPFFLWLLRRSDTIGAS